ncbi:uncharacterized protein B4U80_01638 [Leptotrombidium deliense]|uniref:MD-2-related lipid-recognition domain-containing protein n=1 Tax=Leptotrombidium deliense TaxID=299467 RepID=A0A443S3N7_9ACAR|nr:uncharacterized protein B4U80_01638 [Leptotrombidium deliense]
MSFTLVSGYIPFQFRDCGRYDRTVVFDKLQILPHPIPIQSRSPLNASLSFTLKQTLNNDVKVKIDFRRLVSIFGFQTKIPAPCIGTFGSCEHRFCDLYKDAEKTFCPILQRVGKECTCPIETGVYASNGIPIQLPTVNLPSIIAAIGSGNYELTAKFVDRSGKEIGCIEVKLPVDMSRKY